jgi:hypothetical protein
VGQAAARKNHMKRCTTVFINKHTKELTQPFKVLIIRTFLVFWGEKAVDSLGNSADYICRYDTNAFANRKLNTIQ